METYCQSCGMPLTEEVLGTNADQSKNGEYCMYCYENGKFPGNIKMEEMASLCTDIIIKENPTMNKEEVYQKYMEFLPTLKRWI